VGKEDVTAFSRNCETLTVRQSMPVGSVDLETDHPDGYAWTDALRENFGFFMKQESQPLLKFC
jgi:hypothetical protein